MSLIHHLMPVTDWMTFYMDFIGLVGLLRVRMGRVKSKIENLAPVASLVTYSRTCWSSV